MSEYISKRIKKARGKIRYISCAMQNKITPDKFVDINILKRCVKYLSNDFSFDDIKKAFAEFGKAVENLPDKYQNAEGLNKLNKLNKTTE